jgi:hypothetical protein
VIAEDQLTVTDVSDMDVDAGYGGLGHCVLPCPSALLMPVPRIGASFPG